MGMIVCARCGKQDDESSASFAEEGLICSHCFFGRQQREHAQETVSGNLRLAGDALGVAGALADLSQGRVSVGNQSRSARGVAVASMEGANAKLAERGLRAERSTVTKTATVSVGGVDASSKSVSGYHEVWSLPEVPKVQASFTREAPLDTIVKWFKAEVQTGDKKFDDLVYVSTGTAEATTQFLSNAEVRYLIGYAIERGGSVTIKDNLVEAEFLWDESNPEARPDDLGAQLVSLVLAFQG